ncbi:MAG: hypothetical protein AB3N64_11370 [Puniceicoccaceae bacterium]
MTNKLTILLAALAAPILCLTGHAQTALEADGLVVIEAETQDSGLRFDFGDSITGFKGTGYLRGNVNSFNTPNLGTITYPLRISRAGTYQFAFRSRIGVGTSNTDNNDSFIRLVDSNGNPVTPVPNQNVATSGSWYKVYMNDARGWSHQASNKDNDPHSLSWVLESGQEYAIQMSVRSRDHLVDRFILWDRSQYSLANQVTGKGTNEALFNSLEASNFAPEGTPWGPYFADAQGNVDTGTFLGWLNVQFDPWAWSYSISRYMYLPGDSVTGSGAWTYIPKD